MTEADRNPPEPPKPRALIFQSYGWGDATEVSQRLKEALEASGYAVWLDREKLDPDDREFWLGLEAALKECDLVVALLSPYSVRLQGDREAGDHASVCHSELILAVQKQKPIVPIMVISCEQPLSIISYRLIDLTDWTRSTERWREGVSTVIGTIESVLAGNQNHVVYVDKLFPINFSRELRSVALTYVGREWLFARIQRWLESGPRALLIEGDAGSGKSAFAVELLKRNSGSRILAYHFCNAFSLETVNPRRFVRSIAAMLGGTIAAYGQHLRGAELLATMQSDPATMLLRGVLDPLRDIPMSGNHFIVVDGLDEAAAAAGAPVSEPSIPLLLAGALKDFPPWLKLIATSRPDDRVGPLFQDAERILLAGSEAEQREDLRRYIERRLSTDVPASVGPGATALADIAAALAARSAGNFQYADSVIAALRDGEIVPSELDRLPRGLVRLYYEQAERRFSAPGAFRRAEIVLSVMLAAREPLTQMQLAAITGLERRDELLPTLDLLSCFVTWDFSAGDERVYRFHHKSIGDWLLSPPREADRFKVDPAAGRDRILAHCRNWAAHREAYALRYLIGHLLEIDSVDEAVATVRNGFFELRRERLAEPRLDLADSRRLALALLAAGRAESVTELAGTENLFQRGGVASALQSMPSAADALIDRVVDTLLRLPRPKRGPLPPALLNARYIAIRTAEAKGWAARLLQAARERSPAVRRLAVPMLYRYWHRRRPEGWALLREIARDTVRFPGLPDRFASETFAELSLAVLNASRSDPEQLRELAAIWHRQLERLFASPLARMLRAVARRWVLRLLTRPMAEVMQRQPAYQPVNGKELSATFGRPDDFREMWRQALRCLEEPERGLAPIAATLGRAELPFDLYLMLICERSLIYHGAKGDTAAVIGLVEAQYRAGCAWFRQSALYVLFHVLSNVSAVEGSWLDRYAALAEDFFLSGSWKMATEVAQYRFASHLAWPEIVTQRHRPRDPPQLLPRLLQQAIAAGDEEGIAGLFAAIDTVAFAYGQAPLALSLLERAYAIGGARVEGLVLKSLATVRVQDQPLVDDLLQQRAVFAPLVALVNGVEPAVREEDMPTLLDGFTIQMMLDSDYFRRQVCAAFERALSARSMQEFLLQIVIWVREELSQVVLRPV